jgi:hypothetical protein
MAGKRGTNSSQYFTVAGTLLRSKIRMRHGSSKENLDEIISVALKRYFTPSYFYGRRIISFKLIDEFRENLYANIVIGGPVDSVPTYRP